MHHTGCVKRHRFRRPVLPGLVNAWLPPTPPRTRCRSVAWSWQMTQMSNGAVIVPDGRDRYTPSSTGGTVSVRADCKSGSATYVRSGSTSA
jgi:hypothetical protein